MGVLSKWFGSNADSGASVSTPIPTPTDDPIAEYKVFVDALSQPGRRAEWVRETSWRDDSQSDCFNQFLGGLSPDQRECVAQMVERAEDYGTLNVLNVIDVYGFGLSRNGVELPRLFPYGLTSLWGSWWCRKQGDPWPKNADETFESIKNDD